MKEPLRRELGHLRALLGGRGASLERPRARLGALGALGAVRDGGRVVECDRGALVAPYMGQTALKVREAFDRASGGVLFVDEAHALVESDRDAFGREALDALVKLLEDRRGDVVVVGRLRRASGDAGRRIAFGGDLQR